MKAAVIGAGGQLGSDLVSAFGQDAVGLEHSQAQVESFKALKNMLAGIRPDIIINTAAYHNVGLCEKDPDRAFLINTIGARNVAAVGEELGARVVYISTDYVFSGTKGRPYNEFDRTDPVNIYGLSKLKGEEYTGKLSRRHFIIRVSGLIGSRGSRSKGGNFVERILSAAREKPVLPVVADQFLSPTFTKEAAKKIMELVKADLYGTYHITNSGWCSWFQLAEQALKLAGVNTEIKPVLSSSYGEGVRRPAFSALENYHLKLQGFELLRDWEEALFDYMKENHS